MFELCVCWFAWGFDTSLKAALIAVIAAIVTKLLRFRDSNVQHRVWTGVLAGMLVLPLLTPVVPALRLPLIPSSEALLAWSKEPPEDVAEPTADEPSVAPPAFAEPSAETAAYPPRAVTGANSFEGRLRFLPDGLVIDAPPAPGGQVDTVPADTQPAPLEVELSAQQVAAPAPKTISRRTMATLTLATLATLWLLGSVLLSIRLMAGLWLAERLRQRSRIIHPEDLAAGNAQLFSGVIVRECQHVHVPLTVGAVDPQILLPPDWRAWPADKLLAVLAHERMHVQRADCLVALIAEINCSLYWFHPLAWWLKRHLAVLAEQACDDAAIASLGDRARYARHLLEVAATASRERGRLAPAGLSMARRTGVETRIHSILDFRRPLSQRLTWTKTLALVVLMIPLIALAAALKPSAGGSADNADESSVTSNEKHADEAPAEAAAPDVQTAAIKGRVNAADGKPIAGATVYMAPEPFWSRAGEDCAPREVARSDESGAFQFVARPEDVARASALRVLITAAGYGPEMLPLSEAIERRTIAATLPLDDVPIRGRVLTLEGQPVAGAKISVSAIRVTSSGDLTSYIDLIKAGNGSNFRFDKYIEALPHIKPLETDADGRFELKGIGKSRVAEIEITGQGIQNSRLRVMTLQSEPLYAREGRGFAKMAREMSEPPVFGASFEWLVRPSRPIVGTVVDAKTRQPLAGIHVNVLFQAHAVTDANGRFEITGAAKARNYRLSAHASDQPYLEASRMVADEPGLGPMEVSLEMTRGIVVSGRVIDRATGKPLVARLRYSPLYPNEFVLTGIGGSEAGAIGAFSERATDKNGEFSIPVLPGPGFIGISAQDGQAYQPANVDAVEFFKKEKVPYGREGATNVERSLVVANSNNGWSVMPQSQFNAIELLNLPLESDDRARRDVQLVAAIRVAGVVLDPEGQPLAGASAYGLSDHWYQNARPLTKPEFAVTGLGENEKRQLLFRHDARRLVGSAEATTDMPQPLQVKLQPWAEVSGRLLDTDGAPLANLEIGSFVDAATGEKVGRLPGHTSTNDQGRFHIDGLVPGVTYALRSPRRQSPEVRVVLKPGEKLDVGDVSGKYDSKTAAGAPKAADGAAAEPAKDARGNAVAEDAAFSYAGSVVDPTGKPVAGAKLHLCYFSREHNPDLSPVAVTDAEGKFRFSRRLQDFDRNAEDGAPWHLAVMVATADGFGFATAPSIVFETTGRLTAELGDDWRKELEAELGPQTNVLKLVPDAPIKGRIVNIDGRPVAGARLAANFIWSGKDGSLDSWEKKASEGRTSAVEIQKLLNILVNGPRAAAVVQVIPSDADGWLILKGLGKERLASVLLTGPGIEASIFQVRSREGQTLKLSLHSGAAKETYYPSSFTHVAGPTQPVIGRITDAATGAPIAQCAVQGSLYAGTANGGSTIFKRGEFHTLTDADGRYRLEGLERLERDRPGLNNLLVLPPRGSSYFPVAASVEIRASADPVTHDVTLHRGIRAGGRVLDGRSGKPVLGSLRYATFDDNAASKTGVNGGWTWLDHYHYQTDAEGRFEIPVLPGRGVLGFSAHNWQDYPQGVGLDKVQAAPPSRGRDTAIRTLYSSNLLTPIDLAVGTEETTIDLVLSSGLTSVGRAISPEGQPLKHYLVYGGEIAWLWTQTFGESDTFEIKNYDEKTGRLLMIAEPERNLVGIHQLNGAALDRFDVKLRPGAVIKGRIVDADGLPLENVLITNEAKIVSSPAMIAPPKPEEFGRGVLPHYLDQSRFATDKDGRFELRGIIPGLKYTADAQGPGKLGGRTITMRLGRLFTDVTAQPGQTKDLGDLKLDPNKTQDQLQSKPAEARPAPAPAEQAKTSGLPARVVRGRVIDEQGQPIAAAKLFTSSPSATPFANKNVADVDDLEKGQTDAAGNFSITISGEEFERIFRGFLKAPEVPLLAHASGRGVEWMNIPADRDVSDATFVLRPERPIEGRLIDSEGRPIVGAAIRVPCMFRPKDGDNTLDAFLAAWKREPNGAPWNSAVNARGAFKFSCTTSDQDGRFVIHGVAVERICELEFAASELVIPPLWIVNREGFSAREHYQAPPSNQAVGAHMQLAERVFTQVGLPAYQLVGRVTSEDGQAIANVRVWANNGYNVGVSTQTDADGRYTLAGLARQKRLGVGFDAAKELGWLSHNTIVEHTSDEPQKTLDVVLRRGVTISGRVTDSVTGKGVPAGIHFVPLPGNDFVKRPDYTPQARGGSGGTDADGNFQLQVIPGPGVLMVAASAGKVMIGGEQHRSYRLARFSEEDSREVKPSTDENGMQSFQRDPKYIEFVMNENAVRYVNFEAGKTPQPLHIEVNSGKSVDLELVDASDQPVSGVFISGITEMWPMTAQLTEPRCTVYALGPDRPRRVVLVHKQRGLAGSVTLRGDEPSPLRVTLAKVASLRGRAVDSAGEPIAAVELILNFQNNPTRELYRFLDPTQPKLATDKDGRFEIARMVPGESFGLDLNFEGKYLRAKLAKEQRSLQAGQDLDLGNVVFTTPTPAAEPAPEAKAAAEPKAPQAARIAGSIVDSAGRSIAGAHVAAIAGRINAKQGGDFSPDGEVLAEGTTDQSGRYDLSLSGVSSKTHRYGSLIARSDGSAIAWQRLDLDAHETEASFTLAGDDPIRGRFIDIEGRPVAGVKLQIRSIMMRVEGGHSEHGVGHQGDQRPAAWPAPITCDQEGRFTIRGIGGRHGVYLDVDATDHSAPQSISLNTGLPEDRGDRDATYRALVRNAKPGQEVVLPLSPAQIFEGTVRFEDTKQPAPHARLTVWSSQQREGGSSSGVEGKTDALGRYRIHALPGIRFGVTAYPPASAPYLTRKTTEPIRWDTGDRVKQLDLTLPRGVLVRGQVVDAMSKAPIPGVEIQYHPEEVVNARARDGILTGWQGIQLSDREGKFEIPVLPGRGRLTVHATSGSYVLQDFGSSLLSFGKAGGQRNYAHAIQKIDLLEGADAIDLTVELQPGAKIAGNIVDDDGKRVEETLLISRLDIWPRSLHWRGGSPPVLGGRFELNGLADGVEYPVYFLDAKRRLGATVLVKAGQPEPTVVLKPCGTATMRFVNGEGKPAAEFEPTIHLVVTPGVNPFDYMGMRAGNLTADSDYVGNIDRTNYRAFSTQIADATGKLTLPALIPGATYWILVSRDGKFEIAKEFVAKSGESLDLGEIQVAPRAPAAPAPTVPPARKSSANAADMRTVTGMVQLPNGNPAAGATIRAAAPLYAMMEPLLGKDFKSPLTETKADASGRFSISLASQPFGDVSRLDQHWQQLWKKTVIAASLTGYGPNWVQYEDIESSKEPLTLKLVEDLPIRGRVIDLEGRPIAGVAVKVGEPQAAENEDLTAWIEGIKANELPWTVWKKAPRDVESRLVGTPTTATTDEKGQFDVRGIGRERLVKLVFEGETVAHREVVAVTRAMEPIEQKLVTPNPRQSSTNVREPVFGAEFTFSAAPARVIEGLVLDARSRQPLAGVAVESDRLSGYPYSNHRVLKTTTDKDGRFRLIGMPKGNENRLLILPSDEQPYFMREIDVPDPVGLGSVTMEIELHRGVWITGRVTDKATGEGVPAVRLHYLPYRSNEFAQKLPEFDADGRVQGDQARYQTAADGSYRLVGLPGRAIVGAQSTLKDYRAGVGFDELKVSKNREDGRPDTYRNPIWAGPKWPDVMKEIDPPADAENVPVDFQLDPGLSLKIHVTDAAGNPLTGAAFSGNETADGAELIAANFGASETRTLIIRHHDKKLGRVITVTPEQVAAGQITVVLQPFATVIGRVLNEDGSPLSGMAIAPHVPPSGDFGLRLTTVPTDAEGRFTATLIPGCSYSLAGEGGRRQFISLAKEIVIQPGESKDLGTLKLDKDGKVVAWKSE